MKKLSILIALLIVVIGYFGATGVAVASPLLPGLPVFYMLPYQLNVKNPGFENDFQGWNREQAQFNYGDPAEIDSTVSHSGKKSAKLYLRWGGSEIDQDISVNLPADTSATLSFWMKMPFAGSTGTKWFVGQITAYAVDGHQVTTNWIDQFDPLANWTQKQVNIKPKENVSKLNIKAHTENGNGGYFGFDHPVWVDDFQVSVQCPIGPQSSNCINSLAGLVLSPTV